MTSLNYFKKETPEYDPYEPGGTKMLDSMESSDSPINKKVTLVNKFDNNHQISDKSNFNELFKELDGKLLDSIDDYLYSSSLKRGSKLLIDDLEELIPQNKSSQKSTLRLKRKDKNVSDVVASSTDGDNETSVISERLAESKKVQRSVGGSSITGRSWSSKLFRINSRKNSLEENEVIDLIDSTPSNSIISNTSSTNKDTVVLSTVKRTDVDSEKVVTSLQVTEENKINDPESIIYEADIPIRKPKRRIIQDSQRYTPSDSGPVRDELGNLVRQKTGSTSEGALNNTCDNARGKCSHQMSLNLCNGRNGLKVVGRGIGAGDDDVKLSRVIGDRRTIKKNKSIDEKDESVASSNQYNNDVTTPTSKLSDSKSFGTNILNINSTSEKRTNLSGSYYSDSSDEEEDFDECIICSESMKSELKNEIGVLDVCSHIFCFKCIKMWSDRANSCPLCKREFIYIRKVNLYNIQDLIEKYCSLTSTNSNAATSVNMNDGIESKMNEVVCVSETSCGAPVLEESGFGLKRVGTKSVEGSVGVNGDIKAGSGVSVKYFGDTSNLNNEVTYLGTSVSMSALNNSEKQENRYWRERRLRCIRKNKISKLKKIINEKINWFDLIPSVKVRVERKKIMEDEDEGCTICGNDDNWSQLLLCDSCDKGYHIYCLNPPLTEIPDSNWYCTQCNHEAANGVSLTTRSGSLRNGSLRSGSMRSESARNGTNMSLSGRRALRGSEVESEVSSSMSGSVGYERGYRNYRGTDVAGGGSGIVTRSNIGCATRDSIITISSSTSRRVSDSHSLNEEEIRTNLLSQVYRGLNRRTPNATSRAINAIRSRISSVTSKQKGKGKRGRPRGSSSATRDRNSDISSGSQRSMSTRSSRTSRATSSSEPVSSTRYQERGRKKKLKKSLNGTDTTNAANASIGNISASVSSNLGKNDSNGANLTKSSDVEGIYNNTLNGIGVKEADVSVSDGVIGISADAASIGMSIGLGLGSLKINGKDIDRLIQESLESIDNYFMTNKTRTEDIIFSSDKTPTESIVDRGNEDANTALFMVESNAMNATDYKDASAVKDTKNTSNSTSGKDGQALDELKRGRINLLLSENDKSTSLRSGATNNTSAVSHTKEAASTSDTTAGKKKKYTSFIYRYKTITNEEYTNSTVQSKKQEPYIDGKTVKYLF